MKQIKNVMTCNKDQNEQLSYVFGNIQLRSEGKMTVGDVNDFSGDESKPKFRYIPNYRTMDVFLGSRGVMIDDIAVKDNDITLWILDMKDNDISENHASRENIGQFRDVANMIDINRGFNLYVIDSKTAKEIPVNNFVILEQNEYLTMHLNTTTNNKKENNMKTEQKQKKQYTMKQIEEAIAYWNGILEQINESTDNKQLSDEIYVLIGVKGIGKDPEVICFNTKEDLDKAMFFYQNAKNGQRIIDGPYTYKRS